VSDNRVRLEQLRNLKYLNECNLQFNNITKIQSIQEKDFSNLEVLNLSYNRINPDSLRQLYFCKQLKVLDLASNSLEQLPTDFA